VGLAGAAVGVFAVAVLVGALAGYFLGRIGGSQQGEDAPSAHRSVPVEKSVEKTIPAATPTTRPSEEDTITATTTARPPDTDTATATATAPP
jgi:hypothetical protein